jgi:hypothetical protein
MHIHVKKKGRKQRRSLALEKDNSNGPLKYPVGIVGQFCKIKHMAGVGYISDLHFNMKHLTIFHFIEMTIVSYSSNMLNFKELSYYAYWMF